MKNILIGLLALAVVAGGAYYFLSVSGTDEPDTNEPSVIDTGRDLEEQEPSPFEVLPPSEDAGPKPVESIGSSVDGNDITAYHFGDGENEVMFIGGIHAAFAPNTVDVAEELIDALKSGALTVPENVMVTVIPNLNPDASGQANTVAARLNTNGVDLNRNFDCEWDAEGVWRNTPVSGGAAAFSEPESKAVRDYVTTNKPAGIVTWYSAAGGVFSSNCRGTVLRDTNTLTNLYADASGYSAHEEFDFYEITGDMVNWFAKMEIPAISVLLTDYTNTEWTKNKAGIEAVLNYYAN